VIFVPEFAFSKKRIEAARALRPAARFFENREIAPAISYVFWNKYLLLQWRVACTCRRGG